LWLKIFEIVENPKEFFMQKGRFDQNVLQLSAKNQNDPEIFSFVFNLAENFCESESEKKNLILEKNSVNNQSLLSLTAMFAQKSNLKFLFEKFLEIFGENEMKKVLKTEKGENGRNLLSLNARNKNFDSIKFFWKIFDKNLSREEIFELLNEKDEKGNNILHLAAEFAKSKEIFEFLWLKIKEIFNDKEKLKIYLKVKGSCGKNILLASINWRNENLFFYIFEEIFCKIFELKDFIYGTNEDNVNFIHLLARHGSVSMLDFAFKKLEENLSPEELQNFLRIKNESQKNILHIAAYIFSLEDSCKFLCEMLENILEKNKFKEMLKEKDAENYLPIHYALESNDPNKFEIFAKLYKKYFTKEEIQEFLRSKTFLEFAEHIGL
jgi:ankyrin repeat protein